MSISITLADKSNRQFIFSKIQFFSSNVVDDFSLQNEHVETKYSRI